MVVDASVVVELLLQTADAPRIAGTVLSRGAALHAPQLLDVEVAQVIRRFALRGDISAEHGREAMALLAVMPIARYPHQPLLARIWDLRANLTAYDAAYVALAEGLRCPVVTRDTRLAQAAGVSVEIRVL